MSRKGIQLAYPFEEKRLAKWQPPYIVQPKYDGVRCRAVPLPSGRYMLLSSQENPIFSVPHIIEELDKTELYEELDGELYCHGMSFEEIVSITSRTTSIHSDYGLIKFHIFDMIDRYPQLKRIVRLTQLERDFLNSPVFELAPFWLQGSLEGVMNIFNVLIDMGYEGIIVRHFQADYVRKRSIYMMKFKPKKEDIYEIIGWKEEVSKDGIPKERLGAILCTGDDGTAFSVGSGLTDEAREALWNSKEGLKGKKVRVQYQHITSGKGVPRFPVFLEVIE